ncbi:MAG: YicC family protein [Clostridia bacterium]|nr:YicC family protein [Clostridia bacterium]
MIHMIKSMTGFGRGEATKDNITFSVDIRSVNHRYSDISVRMPRTVSILEEKVREHLGSKLNRGKIDVYINYDSFGQDTKVKLDTNLASAYVDSLNVLKEQFGIKDEISLSLLTRFSDILKLDTEEKDVDFLWSILNEALEQAVSSLLDMRSREGERLRKDMLEKLDNINAIVLDIKEKSAGLVDEYRTKLYDKIKELTKDIQLDDSRILTEVAIFADKSSVDEEIVRLGSHLEEFKKTLNLKTPIGKKLDFIVQEMNREVNTIGSKSGEIGVINNVIAIKTEIEKIREQIQNIE